MSARKTEDWFSSCAQVEDIDMHAALQMQALKLMVGLEALDWSNHIMLGRIEVHLKRAMSDNIHLVTYVFL